jgi:HD-GYP domain-containing protein (c-di-GMP phosphodiesterase class II)
MNVHRVSRRRHYGQDATATHRPYKKAVPWDRALDILYDEAEKGLVDAELLRVFRAAEIFRAQTAAAR